jgi:hypothetical protein
MFMLQIVSLTIGVLMNSFAEPLHELQDRCQGTFCITSDDRALLHNAYWNGNQFEISTVLEVMCFEPDPADLPILLDASSPGSLWVHRCDAAQVFGGLEEEGRAILRIMLGRETHPIARFYVMRELIDLEDESMASLLVGPIPPVTSPNLRSLWVYGNFEQEALGKERALRLIDRLMEIAPRRHNWLNDHILGS